MKTLISKILILLRIRKPFIWTPSEKEVELHEKANLKIFKPTINCLNLLAKGGDFNIKLSYKDSNGNNQNNDFKTNLKSDNQSGIKFKITLPNILNIGAVNYKESYGLDEKLTLNSNNLKLFIPNNSVSDFETIFPAKPQILQGRFDKIQSLENRPKKSFCRIIIPVKDKEAIFPTSILDYKENHMKFDISNWDRQSSFMGIPFMSTMQMFSELTIYGVKLHFYGIKQIDSYVIDSTEEIDVELFLKISYAIRLCFALLSGKFYKNERYLICSEDVNFSNVGYFDYQVEGPTIVTENQIINPTFFFSQYSIQNEEIQNNWKEFHKMFDIEIFSRMCEKTIVSPEFMRSLELINNAGSLNDPVQKGALYSVCIETLTELLKNENIESFNPIPKNQKPIWKKFHGEIKILLDKIQDEISEDGYKILNNKIDNLNSPTNRDKLEKPFKMVGISLTKEELESLDQRNKYLHGGQPDDRNWITKSNLDALKLHCLIGKLILKYFNYTGHYINVAGWFILHDKETATLMHCFDYDELTEALKRINSNSFESTEQIEKAKLILSNFERFRISAMEIEDLIKII
jgi:hypothetical protein